MLGARPYRRSRPLRRQRPWDAVSWWFSLLLVVPIAILGFTAMRHMAAADPSVTLRVTDAFTGKPLPGAQVSVGQERLTTDKAGEVTLSAPTAPQQIVVRDANYEAMSGTLDKGADAQQAVALRPTTLSGKITDEKSGQAIVGVVVSAFAGGSTKAVATTTAGDGTYHLSNVPPNARIHIDAGDYGTVEEDLGQRTEVDFKLRLSVVTGAVTDASGKPVQGAIVRAGKVQAVTNADGMYRLAGAPESGDLTVSASGYGAGRVAISAGKAANVQLQQVAIKALHLTPDVVADTAKFNHLIDLVDHTELNAMVVDIKEGAVYYNTQVQFFRDAGVVQPTYDVNQLLRTLHEHKIYAIARLVVFKDPQVAAHYPNLAVRDTKTGGVWQDSSGAGWLNAFDEGAWTPNIDLAVEAAHLGFDEIQYDYVRFPSDGDLSTADFGHTYTQATRVQAITDFLETSRKAINAAGAKLGVDIFGITTLYDDDQGIGQNLRAIAPVVDYVCPMVYPSHFSPDSIDVGGQPNDHPYQVIQMSMAGAKERMPGMLLKLRPWLQDFQYPGMRAYTTADVLAQIKAAEEAGTSGWMIWNDNGEFHEDAFKPEQK